MCHCGFLLIFCFYALTINGEMPEFAEEEPFQHGIRIHHILQDELQNHQNFSKVQQSTYDAMAVWEIHLSLPEEPSGNLLIPRKCEGSFQLLDQVLHCETKCIQSLQCGQYVIPSDYLQECKLITSTHAAPNGTGLPKADFLLVLEIATEKECFDTSTRSHSCSSDLTTDRPVAGVISICPHLLTLEEKMLTRVLSREIGHLLGMNWEGLPFLRDRSGVPRIAREANTNLPATRDFQGNFVPDDSILIMKQLNLHKTPSLDSQELPIITLPTVVEVVKHIFEAPDARGMWVEPRSEKNSFALRFDSRFAQDDIMSSDLHEKSWLSLFTLAFMYDTGWYNVSSAELGVITWGVGAGNEFLEYSCDELTKLQQTKGLLPMPFCGWRQHNVPSCLPDHSGFGLCDIRESSTKLIDSPTVNVDLKSHTFSGPEHPAKYCPVIKRSRDLRLVNRISDDCKQQPEAPITENTALETFGKNSICVEHDRDRPFTFVYNNGSVVHLEHYGASCHYHVCEPLYGLRIHFEDRFVYCPLEGGRVGVDVEMEKEGTVKGNILCPPCAKLCPKEHCQISHPTVCPSSSAEKPADDTVPLSSDVTEDEA